MERTERRMSRKWVVLAGAALGAVLLLLLAVPYLLNVGRIRVDIETAASSALGRPVQIGQLRFSLLTGTLTADDLSITEDEAFGRGEFLHANSLAVGVEVLPLLLSERLRVNALTLDGPQVNLVRTASGRWNYASLGAREKNGAAPAQPPVSSSGLTSYFVRELKTDDGQISIGGVPRGAPAQTFRDVSLVATDISSGSAFRMAMGLTAPKGGKIKLEGTAGPIEPGGKLEQLVIHLKLHGQRVGIAGMEGLLENLGIPLPAGAALRGGSLDADLSVDGPLGRLVIAGPVTLSDVEISGFNFATWVGGMASLGGIKNSPDTLIQSIHCKVRAAPEGIRLDDVNVVMAEVGPITGAGTISAGNALEFHMKAELHANNGPLGGVRAVASLGQGSGGIPFEVQGTTAHPVFVSNAAGAVGNTLTLPVRGVGRLFGKHKDEKKP